MEKGRKIFWGVFLILGAVCIFLDSVHLLPYISGFKLIITLILVALLVKNIVKFSFAGILIPLAFLVCLYREKIGLHVSSWTILVVAVILSIGLELLAGKRNGGR
jgi:hypothetical protein